MNAKILQCNNNVSTNTSNTSNTYRTGPCVCFPALAALFPAFAAFAAFAAFPAFATTVVVLCGRGVGHFVLDFLQHVFQEIVRFDPTLLLDGPSAAHTDGVLFHFVAPNDHDVVVLALDLRFPNGFLEKKLKILLLVSVYFSVNFTCVLHEHYWPTEKH